MTRTRLLARIAGRLLLCALAAPGAAGAQEGPGTVEGVLTVPAAPARKWAARYPGAPRSVARLQPVAPVVWLERAGGPPATRAADTATVGQADTLFAPSALAVRTGTVVRFPNDDPFYHNVFSYSGPRFDLGRYPPGDSRAVVLDRPGVVEIHCEIHEFMRAVVVVTDDGLGAVVAGDGSFRIGGVPPGRYTLHAYHPDLGSVTVPVTVAAGAVTPVRTSLGG